MENFSFNKMAFPQDKAEINNWQNIFKGTEGFNSIYEYVLENGLIYNLEELINTNYEICPIGDDEAKLALTVLNKQNEIVGFVICQEFDINTDNPELFLQYVVVRPDMQNKGVGSFIFKNLPHKIEKITGKKPVSAFSYIESTNLASQKLYKKFGFNLQYMRNSNKFLIAKGTFEPQLEK